MSKAPDTRGKIDTQSNIKPRKKPVLKKKNEVTKGNRRVTLGDIQKEASPLKLKKEKKPSKGQLFKAQHGYSKTMKRNLKANGLDINAFSDSINEYRAIRKKRKAAIRKIQQKKHADKAAYRRANSKSKGSKGKSQAPKVVPVKAAA